MLHFPFASENRLVLCADTLTKRMYWHSKSESEKHPSLRQIIPYVTVSDGTRYLVYQRLKGEQRLAGNLSIGIGGHVEASDADAVRSTWSSSEFYSILFAAWREFVEECLYTSGSAYMSGSFLFHEEEYPFSELHTIPGARQYFGQFLKAIHSPDLDFSDRLEVAALGSYDLFPSACSNEALHLLIKSDTEVDRAHLGIVLDLRLSPQFLEALSPSPEIKIIGLLTSNELKALDSMHAERQRPIVPPSSPNPVALEERFRQQLPMLDPSILHSEFESWSKDVIASL
jgi:predicted NUDIX family phosphoesterase